jgi:hypothetical protein
MIANELPDVMLVCANGHVLTDQLNAQPERDLTHCDRCGATTLAGCRTCGRPLPGAISVPGLTPIGTRQPPQHCPTCGASFPWTRRPERGRGPGPLAVLDGLLRRLPRVARELRSRHGDRPAFRVADEYDLADLLRALLPLHFDDVRPEGRTPSYTPGNRTDLLLAPEGIAVTGKRVRPGTQPQTLANELAEDIRYYEGRAGYRCLVGFVYDPEQLLPEPRRLEAEWSRAGGELDVRCVIA